MPISVQPDIPNVSWCFVPALRAIADPLASGTPLSIALPEITSSIDGDRWTCGASLSPGAAAIRVSRKSSRGTVCVCVNLLYDNAGAAICQKVVTMPRA